MSPVTVKWHGKEVSAKAHAGAARGLYKWAEHVLEGAEREVPVAPSGGTLQSSGKAHPCEGSKLQTAVSFDTPYAVKQHEEMDYHHTRPGAKAKYLEDPLNASKDKGNEIVAAEIKKELS
jgi:hypothetical protein